MILKWLCVGLGRLPTKWGASVGDPMEKAKSRIRERNLYLWVDEELASMAMSTGRTPNGVRISMFYTPSNFRGRGYTTACVAQLSAELLARGMKLCFLYTDLSNSTSNSIYQRIGYQSVFDIRDIDFDPNAKMERHIR